MFGLIYGEKLVRRRKAMPILLATILAGSTLLAGCTPDAKDADVSSGNGLKGLKQSQFAFDNYLGVELEVIDYARQGQFDICLDKAGFPQNLKASQGRPFPDTSPFQTTPDQFGPASAEQARLKGFGKDPGWTPPRMSGVDKNYEKAADACQATAWAKFPAGAEQVTAAYQDLGNELLPYRAEVDNRLPKDLSRKMLDCIKAKGRTVPDEAQFLQTPQPQVMGVDFGDYVGGSTWVPDPERKGVQVAPPASPRKYQPTAPETALAVDWYHCQQDSGWTKTQLQVAAEVQREYIEQRADRLLELNPKIQDVAKQAAILAGRG